MKPSSLLRPDQKQAIDFLYGRDESLLFADIGTGKTVVALTVMQCWLRDKVADRILVVAPTRVCNDVWENETTEWKHLVLDEGLLVQSVAGENQNFRRDVFDNGGCNIICVNYENLPWLMKEYPDGIPGFNAIWFDEVDKMKNPTSLRFKGRGRKGTKTWKQGVSTWRENFDIKVGMTGTPVSNGLLDLWAQAYCIDGGQRLGPAFWGYQRKYFYQSDWSGYKWSVYPDAVPRIYDAVSDVAFRIEARREAAEVVYTPPRVVILPPKVRKAYKQMEREYVAEYQNTEVAALNAAGAYNKLRQMSAGFVYEGDEETRTTTDLHDEKYKELDSLISELNGAQLLVVYQFKAQADELRRRYKKNIMCLDSQTGTVQGSEAIKLWNDGELPILGIQPQSAGHGLNLQLSGAHHICMLTEPESAGLYNQVVGRLAREGQINTVFVHTIHSAETIDEDRAKVVNSKRTTLQATLDAIKERQNG